MIKGETVKEAPPFHAGENHRLVRHARQRAAFRAVKNAREAERLAERSRIA